jgi:hypothetical protein
MGPLATAQIFLDILVDRKTTACYEFVERQWIFRIVDFSLEHGIKITKIDVRVFYQGQSRV